VHCGGARAHVARTVNTAMVHAYWLIGQEIVEVEQEGRKRAEYGERLVERLAEHLSQRFGKGFNTTGLKRMRQFYRSTEPFRKVRRYPSNLAVRRKVPQRGTFLPA
jgi:hypothetical protein